MKTIRRHYTPLEHGVKWPTRSQKNRMTTLRRRNSVLGVSLNFDVCLPSGVLLTAEGVLKFAFIVAILFSEVQASLEHATRCGNEAWRLLPGRPLHIWRQIPWRQHPRLPMRLSVRPCCTLFP